MTRAGRIGWTTGENTLNRTMSRAQVGGTDLGIMWDDGAGGVLAVWGDTFNGHPDHGAGDWRSNVLARSTNRDVAARGLVVDADGWFCDRPGHARQIIPRDREGDFTIIPSSGVAVRGRQYVSYFSVRQWGAPGRWTTGYAGFAISDNHGWHWIKDNDARWGNSGVGRLFQTTALVDGGDGHLYIFGSPNGRDGAAHLARVPTDQVLDLNAHQQWDGHTFVRTDRPAEVIPGPVSEMSVAWHAARGRWIAGYYQEDLNAIVVRTAPALPGPWSSPTVIVSGDDYPFIYGCFWHPWTLAGGDLCFSMSQWSPDLYATEMMRLPAGGGRAVLLSTTT